MRNNQSGGKGGKGYYIALVLCAAAIGITSYVTRTPHKPEPEPQTQALMTQQPTVAAVPRESQAVEAIATTPAPAGTKPTLPEETQSGKTQPEARQEPLKTAAPLSGTPCMVYAMDHLSYNETTRDWRTHNGVDYPGAEGEPVRAAAAGTVLRVREDDLLGTTVVLRHAGGYETTYAGLEQDARVAPGDSVALGQTIGTVGTTALGESALGPHIHFSVSHQDMPMNPADFLELD